MPGPALFRSERERNADFSQENSYTFFRFMIINVGPR